MNQADVYFKHWKILGGIYQDSELAINAPIVESSAKVSIEYAISVLEEVYNTRNSGTIYDSVVEKQIRYLKSLI